MISKNDGFNGTAIRPTGTALGTREDNVAYIKTRNTMQFRPLYLYIHVYKMK